MFLFIFESIGTSELILVGIVALIFLGPRKLPEIARKIGKITAEFRGTANEFKETWQREVNFEEEAKAFDLGDLDAEPIPRTPQTPESAEPTPLTITAPPAIRAVDDAEIERLMANRPAEETADNSGHGPVTPPASDKKNWL